MDDGSTDATRAIASSYAARDKRFSVLTGPGAGVSAARNFGLASVNGERLLFLDSDDWVAPSFLETLGAALDANSGAFAAYCAYQRVTPEGALTEARLSTELEWAPFEVMARRCGAALHCFLVNRALIDVLGGFDVSLRTCEEWDLWQRAARTGARFVAVRSPLAFYRMSPTSLSRDVRIVIADAEIVIDRGFSADARVVQPAPAHAGGADPAFGGAADLALSYFTLWCAAHEVGRGAAIDQILAASRLSDFKNELNTVVEVIFEALYVGARCAPSELAPRWSEFEILLYELLKRLEASSSCSGLARRLQYSLERRILYATDMTAPTVLGLTAAAPVDIRRPVALTLPPKVDRLLLAIHAADRRMGMTEMAVFAPVSSRDVAKAALHAIGLRTFVSEIGRIIATTRVDRGGVCVGARLGSLRQRIRPCGHAHVGTRGTAVRRARRWRTSPDKKYERRGSRRHHCLGPSRSRERRRLRATGAVRKATGRHEPCRLERSAELLGGDVCHGRSLELQLRL